MEWEYITHGVEGLVELFGIKIFDYDWIYTNKRVTVKDPFYKQEHLFSVWKVKIEDTEYQFAAGEFSNLVWGFYLPKSNTSQHSVQTY